MNQPTSAATMKEYRTQSTAAIPSGLTASIPYRLERAGTVVDVVAPEGFEVSRVSFGKRTIELDSGERVSDKLRAEPYESTTGGAYMIVSVKNTTGDARVAEIAIRVVGEHGQVAATNPFRVTAKGSGAYAVDEDGGPMPYSPSPTRPTAPGAPMPKERMPSGFGAFRSEARAAARAESGGEVRSVRRPPMHPPAPSPTASKKKAQTLKRWRGKSSRRAGTPEIITVEAESVTIEPQVSSPAESGTSVQPDASPIQTRNVVCVLAFRAYAEALLHALDREQTVSHAYRRALAIAFKTGAESEGITPPGRNQVGIFVPRAVAASFAMAVERYQESRAPEKTVVRAALVAVIDPSRAVAPGESAETFETEPETQTMSAVANEKSHENGRSTAIAAVLPLNARQSPDDGREGQKDGERHVP